MTGYGVPTVERRPPSALEADDYHPRPQPAVSQDFVRNVTAVGIIHAPIGRYVNGTIRILDGMRRIEAARRAGIEDVDVLVYEDIDDSSALQIVFTQAVGAFTKTVTDNDRDASLRELVDNEQSSRALLADVDYHELRYRLGLDSDVDVIMRELGDIKGIGPIVARNLVDDIGPLPELKQAARDELEAVEGIGGMLAGRIRRHFHHSDDDWRVTSNV